jgi:hypothetical protein
MKQHYSPRTPLTLADLPGGSAGKRFPADTGVILWRRPTGAFPRGRTYWLSTRGSVPEAARRLYAVLRRADRAGHTRLVVESIPIAENSLAAAISDRLRRAATRS